MGERVRPSEPPFSEAWWPFCSDKRRAEKKPGLEPDLTL